ncbi:MAG TPA: DNRLRE domain-containing protein [Acidimicrobiia bacterium]|nr:DNRLRE domain-containing protein [Acidimicrobiia bacterium]
MLLLRPLAPRRWRPPRLTRILAALAMAAGVAVPATASPAGAAPTSVAIPASADAKVAQAKPTANLGTATTLQVDRSPVLESFVAFHVDDPGAPVTRATLRLFVVNQSGNGPKVYRSDAGWSETAVTWNTRPARHELLADVGKVAAGRYVSYDVTAAVTGAGDVSFDLVADSTDGTDFNTREASGNRPELVVETDAGSPPPPPPPPPPGALGDISTLAGTSAGFSGDGGPATAAALRAPRTMAADAAGNVYIVDTENHRVRKVDTHGIITTIAGTGSAGYGGDGGPAASARLNTPHGIGSDPAGNVYVADPQNQRIRRIDAATGIITTVAGTGSAGFSGDGGPATSARLNYPKGTEIAPDGNLYIADNNNHRVRRVDLGTGVITTVAGTGTAGFSGDGGPATDARLDEPRNIAFDSAGRLYIVDQNNGRIRRVDTDGRISTFASGFSMPRDVAVDDVGNVYVADETANRIRRISPSGVVTDFAGTGTAGLSGDGGPADQARIKGPRGVAYDAATDTVLIGDTANSRIRAVRLSG